MTWAQRVEPKKSERREFDLNAVELVSVTVFLTASLLPAVLFIREKRDSAGTNTAGNRKLSASARSRSTTLEIWLLSLSLCISLRHSVSVPL